MIIYGASNALIVEGSAFEDEFFGTYNRGDIARLDLESIKKSRDEDFYPSELYGVSLHFSDEGSGRHKGKIGSREN